MPNSKQAIKRVRQNAKRRIHNRATRADLRTEIKRYRVAVKSKDEAAGGILSKVESKLDRAAKRGMIPTGRANRLKSRLKRLQHTASASA